jgi:hypothetical protein
MLEIDIGKVDNYDEIAATIATINIQNVYDGLMVPVAADIPAVVDAVVSIG